MSTTDEFAERVFEMILGMMDGWSVFLGDKLGYYRVLAGRDGMTVGELAAEVGANERYTSEWLEQQTTTGILLVDDPALSGDKRRYTLPDAHSEVLADGDNPNYLTPIIRAMTAAGVQLPALERAYRQGGGVSWEQFGVDVRTGQAEGNRPAFINELGATWFPSVPDLDSRLAGGALVADIGCGEGWSSIAMAKSYPKARIFGFDIDAPSIEAARANAEKEGVGDRVIFTRSDGAALTGGPYDVVTFFECVHDMPYPVDVLRSARTAATDDAFVLVMDEAVADAFGDASDEVERLMYGFSLFICLPDSMSHEGSVATGTVIRPDTLRKYATQAGFSGTSVLPIENDLWRFYRLEM